MKLIKETKSRCPECLKVVNASIFEKENGVWMHKKCDEHGEFEAFVEQDADFYKRTMNDKNETCPFQSVVMPITHKCNLNCSFCFVPNRKLEDEPLDNIKKQINKIIIEESPQEAICLSGGEPTLRQDLFEIIKFIKRQRPFLHVTILTNGIKLADLSYVKKLKEAGLDSVTFSLNGFDDAVYQKINNAKLSSIKIKALNNLKKEKVATILSPTLVRGLNEKELKPIFDFALNNLDFVKEVRMRGAAAVGRYFEINPLTTSEMLELTSNALDVDKDFFLRDFSKKDCYHSAYHFHTFLFIDQDKRIIDWSYYKKFKKPTVRNAVKAIKILFNILSRKKIKDIFLALIKSGILMPALHRPFRNWEGSPFLRMLNVYILRINIWYWADKNNVDLNEIKAWGMKHATADGKVLPFSEAMIRADEL